MREERGERGRERREDRGQGFRVRVRRSGVRDKR
jgi:hypothetical protein